MIKRELKNLGIKPIEELSVQEKTNIAEKVAAKLVSLNVPGVMHNEILENLFDAKMYTAQMSNNIGKVYYFSKNKSIYFEQNINLKNLDENIMCGCIQYLQDKREKSEKITRKGISIIEKYKVTGRALNEIAVSYLSKKLLDVEDKSKTGILLRQISLVTGEKAFFDTILNSNNTFEEKFIKQNNSAVLYSKVQNSFDLIIDLEQIIKRLNSDGRKSANAQKYLSKINMHKNTVTSKFSEMQWEIYNRYFSRKIELIEKTEEIKQYKDELFYYNELLEISGDESRYTNFVNEKFKILKEIELQISKNEENAMTIVENGRISKIIRSIKKMLFKSSEYESNM